jgi:hypothetical protein
MNLVLIPACLLAIVSGTFLVVRVVSRWAYRDEFDPDNRNNSAHWWLWEREFNRKDRAS